jgi:hypothetical protein
VFAPNRLRPDHLGQQSLVPCGWLRITNAESTVIEDAPLETVFEQVFAAAMSCVAAHDWPTQQPFFHPRAAAHHAVRRGAGGEDTTWSSQSRRCRPSPHAGTNQRRAGRTWRYALRLHLRPGDLRAALRAIRARVLLLPSETDLYFRVADNVAEMEHRANAKLLPIPSIWGHRAGNPSRNPVDAEFLRNAVQDWMAPLKMDA